MPNPELFSLFEGVTVMRVAVRGDCVKGDCEGWLW